MRHTFLMDAANKGCSTCVLSASDASEYGPIVVYQDLNLLYETPGQCISELEGDPSDASCGAKVYATIDCTVSACFDCGDMDYTALLKCLSTARQGYCKPYADAETACLADLAQNGLDVDVCLWDEQNEDYFVYAKGLSLLGCGP
ncbi:MAG: hypothetical protein R3F14_27450 [Polyangiaceae bacterium]